MPVARYPSSFVQRMFSGGSAVGVGLSRGRTSVARARV
jgi:hypothetical protein